MDLKDFKLLPVLEAVLNSYLKYISDDFDNS